MPQAIPAKTATLLRPSLLIPCGALVFALLVPWVWLQLPVAMMLYGAALGVEPNLRRRLLTRIGIVWLLVLLGTIPLLIERVGAESLYSLWGWGISRESIDLFALVSLRAITAFGAMTLLTQLNPIYQLTSDLRAAGAPDLFVELLELSYRYIYVLEDTARQIALAQVSRLGYLGGYRSRLGHLSILLSRTFVLAHSQADQIYDGLVSRGFDDEATAEPPTPTSDSQHISLSLRALSHCYRPEHYALRGVSLEINRGERIALLGANGAGKSTLMRIASGLLRCEEGQIELSGQAIEATNRGMKRLRQSVALVLQNANHQLFCPSVQDEIAFGLKNMGLEGDRLTTRVESIIDCYNLHDLRHQPPHKLSEGQKKWVSLAAVLATEPDIILLDEPTASLDRYYTHRVMELLDRLNRSGKTILLSTHDMNLAYQWASRILVMSSGELIADGSADEVFADDALLARANLDRPLLMPSKSVGQARDAAQYTDADYSLALFHPARSRQALVVGGGRGAKRKVQTLLVHGAHCTVLAPELDAELAQLLPACGIEWRQGHYSAQVSLEPYWLVVAATGQEALDREIATRAASMGLLTSTLSESTGGNIQFAAQHSGQGLDLAIHTHYRLPEIAQCIRDEVSQSLRLDEEQLRQLARLREAYLAQAGEASEAYRQEYEQLKAQIIAQIRYDWVNRD
ncbi:MAG: ATP-binding cassette domain-containing protein [Porphyromonadaceae bacterium]|nr:ATP-binding cassette domain-containing protein [Porphyromonadaceae bacterium]